MVALSNWSRGPEGGQDPGGQKAEKNKDAGPKPEAPPETLRPTAHELGVFLDTVRLSTIVDPDGRAFLDFAAGWAVAITGYGHPRVVAAIKTQAERLSFAGYSTVSHPAFSSAWT